MSQYYINAIMLENCPYSIAADKLLKDNKIPNKAIWINQQEKERYVSGMISTFPQIYLKKMNSKGSLLLGGHDNLKESIDNFKSMKNNMAAVSDNFINKYKWSKKATLRFIQLIIE